MAWEAGRKLGGSWGVQKSGWAFYYFQKNPFKYPLNLNSPYCWQRAPLLCSHGT